MIRRRLRDLFRLLFWSRCSKHGHNLPFKSDLCPFCVRTMANRYETEDHVARELLRQPSRPISAPSS